MQLLGVIDLRRGLAVHARAGTRSTYAPVIEAAGVAVDGDARVLARVYREIGLDGPYLADLDALEGEPVQEAVLESLVRDGGSLWVDAGVATIERARRLRALGANRVIVPLETLPSYAALGDICGALGTSVTFGLDLRDGRPVTAAAAKPETEPAAVARRARDAGVAAIIVLDLARVGLGGGPDLRMLATIREAVPDVALLAGGGIRDRPDLERLAAAGIDGALVASAVHNGAIGRGEVAAVRHRPAGQDRTSGFTG
jgi:phosphoribosylformimino-5-aminoimidazole carboxamide ribotide isomerase